MATTWTRSQYVSTPIGRIGGTTDETQTENLSFEFEGDIQPTDVDKEINIAWVRSRLKAIAIHCRKNDPVRTASNLLAEGMTLESNSTSSPGDTVTLVAGTPVIWMADYDPAGEMPFASADVTKIYVNPQGSVIQELQLAVLMDEA